MSTAYPKTENLFAAVGEGKERRMIRSYRLPEFGQIAQWLVTEKIDGTNIRLELNGGRSFTASVEGRTDAAQLPKNFVSEAIGDLEQLRFGLIEALNRLIPERSDDAWAMTIYGEGYGAGIQKGGGSYSPTKKLRIFDVVTYRLVDTGLLLPDWQRSTPLWRTWADVEATADALGIPTVPVVMRGAPTEMVADWAEDGVHSAVAGLEGTDDILAEGLIARTDPYLYNHRGGRVMFKCKTEDMRKMAQAEREHDLTPATA